MRDTKIIRICTKWFKYLYSNTRSWYGAMVQKLNCSLSHGSNQRRSEEEETVLHACTAALTTSLNQ